MVVGRPFNGEPAIVICTGPSLDGPTRARVRELRERDQCRLFGINNTYRDFPRLDVYTACDPKWWAHYASEVTEYRQSRPLGLDPDCWHWDRELATQHDLNWIRGEWRDGLSIDPRVLHYGHASSYQALGLARHYGCSPIVLVGFDMDYPPGGPRHYFTDLSDDAGEYPDALRKHSTFEGLRRQFETVARQAGLPTIYNATPGSAFRSFPQASLDEVFGRV